MNDVSATLDAIDIIKKAINAIDAAAIRAILYRASFKLEDDVRRSLTGS